MLMSSVHNLAAGPETTDSEEHCSAWAHAGECLAHSKFMHETCARSCSTIAELEPQSGSAVRIAAVFPVRTLDQCIADRLKAFQNSTRLPTFVLVDGNSSAVEAASAFDLGAVRVEPLPTPPPEWASFGGTTSRSGSSKPAFLAWMVRRKRFTHVWHVEEDAFFAGSWKRVTRGHRFVADLVVARVMRHAQTSDNDRLQSCSLGRDTPCVRPRHAYSRVLWPALRLSRRFALLLADRLSKGEARGHHEVLTAQMCERTRGCSVVTMKKELIGSYKTVNDGTGLQCLTQFDCGLGAAILANVPPSVDRSLVTFPHARRLHHPVKCRFRPMSGANALQWLDWDEPAATVETTGLLRGATADKPALILEESLQPLEPSEDDPSITFFVLAHDVNPRASLTMRTTWLRGERTFLVVAPGTPAARSGQPELHILRAPPITLSDTPPKELTPVTARVAWRALGKDSANWTLMQRRAVRTWSPLAPFAGNATDGAAWPEWATWKRLGLDSIAGSSINGTHPRSRGEDKRRALRRINVHLRLKVFATMHLMCSATSTSHAMLLDEDTAVNVSRLQQWLRGHRSLTGGGSKPFYGGSYYGRAENGFDFVGGGPGVLFSRSGVRALCKTLHACAACVAAPPCVGMSSALSGDALLGACAAAARLTPWGPPEGESLLFSRWPPWALTAEERSYALSFHRVQPSVRAADFDPDSRCRVLSFVDRLVPTEQSHACASAFVFAGAPNAGLFALLRLLRQHSDVVLPPVWGHRPLLMRNDTLRSYAAKFPHVDPRDFRVAGEAQTNYVYSPHAASFFVGTAAQASHVRVVFVLNHPVMRWLAAFAEARIAMLRSKGGLAGAAHEAWELSGVVDFAHLVRKVEWSDRACGHDRARMACASSTNARSCCVSPLTYQSMYELFLPRWLPHDSIGSDASSRLLVLFSENLAGGKRLNSSLEQLGRFLQLPPFAFDVERHELAATRSSGVAGEYVGAGPMSFGRCEEQPAAWARGVTDSKRVHNGVLQRAQAVMTPTVAGVERLLKQRRSMVTQLPPEWHEAPACVQIATSLAWNMSSRLRRVAARMRRRPAPPGALGTTPARR